VKNNAGDFNWSKLPKGAEEVLGEDFWNDFRQFFPKKGPSLDLFETEKEGILYMELPGLQSIRDITIRQNGTHLIIFGYIPGHSTDSKGKALVQERFTGAFERQVPIPFLYASQQVSAKYRNGLLEIRLPKISMDRQIHVNFE